MKINNDILGYHWEVCTEDTPYTIKLTVSDDNKYTDYIIDTAYELGLCVLKRQWQSKYNKYVVYDEEPFCTEGFKINYFFDATHRHIDYFLWLVFNKYLSNIQVLEASYSIPPKLRFKDRKDKGIIK